jgi:hypothetical protein
MVKALSNGESFRTEQVGAAVGDTASTGSGSSRPLDTRGFRRHRGPQKPVR